MPSLTKRILILLVAYLVLFLRQSVRGAFDATIVYHRFRGLDTPLSDYQIGVDLLMRNLIENTGHHAFSYYANYNRGDVRVYGHGGCVSPISTQDCSDCLRVAHTYRVHFSPFVRNAQLCSDEEKQVMLIDEVSLYWKNNTQMTAVAIDRMMVYRLISNSAILRWVFSPANVEQFHTSDRPWEILGNAVSKTFNRIADLRKEITSLKNSIVLAEEYSVKAQAELDTAELKLVLVEGKPTLGENSVRLKRLQAYADKAKEKEASLREVIAAKEALLRQALDEHEVLFLNLYSNFSIILNERLPDPSETQTLKGLKSNHVNEMAVDAEESSNMEMDDENEGVPKKCLSNGETNGGSYAIGEKEQWCLSTLGHHKAFSRQYASEIWPRVKRLDAEVLTEDVHPLVRISVYSGQFKCYLWTLEAQSAGQRTGSSVI